MMVKCKKIKNMVKVYNLVNNMLVKKFMKVILLQIKNKDMVYYIIQIKKYNMKVISF